MKARNTLILTAALLVCGRTCGAATLAELDWLSGRWSEEKPGARVEEAWLGPRAGRMVGVNLSSSAKGSSFEYLRLEESDGVIRYLASPGGGAATAFTLKTLSAQRVVFENLANDFPQRIIYWKHTDGSLSARIEGSANGKIRAMEWHFAPSKP